MRTEEVKGEAHQGNWYVLVFGLSVGASPLPIASGLTLKALDVPLSVFDLAAAGSVGFREWAVLEPLAAACTSEIESAADAAILPGYDTLNRAWLASALLNLRGFAGHLSVACCGYSWNLIAGHRERVKGTFFEQAAEEGIDAAVNRPRQDLPPFKGGLLDYHLHTMIETNRRIDSVSRDDGTWLQGAFETFNDLAAKSAQFRFALEAAIDWRYARDPRAGLARIWSGIESLFGISAEIVYRLSVISASLLTPRGKARKAKYDAIKKLYGVRSKAVHGESMPDDVLIHAMNDSYQVLRELLLLAVAKGRPLSMEDFDEAVFG
jgi:hypothetical protein